MADTMDALMLLKRRATAHEAIEIGIRLNVLKKATPHGEFTARCDALGFSDSVARRYMVLARRFHGAPGALLTAAGGFGKLVELIALDDDEIEAIGRGKEVRGLSLSALERMTVRQVREALRAGQDMPPHSRGKAPNAATSRLSGGVQQAEYCRCLVKVIMRYLKPSELQAYGEHLEAFAAKVTANRPAQGLHDASYHLRMRFKMPGAAPDNAN